MSMRPFGGGLFVFIMLLFGGVTVEQNTVGLGTNSYYAITGSSPPAKEKVNSKNNRLYNHVLKWMKPDNQYSKLGKLVIIILVALSVATIGFGIWSVSLFIAAKYVAGIVVGILSLASLFGIIKFLLS